jgi:hypothetical protein
MKILLTLVGTLFIAVIVAGLAIVVYDVYRRFRRKVSEGKILEIQRAWKEIIREKDMGHAILEADKLLDHALNLMGYRGNLGTKLKKSHRLFGKNINRVWAAHKVRNNIAHQMNYKVDEQTYRSSMLAFKEAFRDLKIFN